MDISKAFHVGVDYKDRRDVLNWDGLRFVEIVIIDKTVAASYPAVYQFNDNNLDRNQFLQIAKSSPWSLSKETFLFAGNALSIDKHKKHILLTNNSIIAYDCLVIASGKKNIFSCQDEELATALQILHDALKVKPKMSHASTSVSNHLIKKENAFAASEKSTSSEASDAIEKIAYLYMAAQTQHLQTFNLDTLNSRFYEVHT